MEVFLQKTTKCIDHTQLAVYSNPEEKTIIDGAIIPTSNDNPETDECVCKDCGAKEQEVAISSQSKTIHNESETDIKDQECGLMENYKDSEETQNTSVAEHIRLKTF